MNGARASKLASQPAPESCPGAKAVPKLFRPRAKGRILPGEPAARVGAGLPRLVVGERGVPGALRGAPRAWRCRGSQPGEGNGNQFLPISYHPAAM